MFLDNQKHLFDIEEEVTYLNCAAYTPLLKASYMSGLEGLNRKYHPWNLDNMETPAEAEHLRSLFASLIGAHRNNVAIINSTSYGVAVMARNLPVETGQNIVVIADQFPSNFFTWRHLAQQKGGKLKVVSRPEDGNWTPNILEAITPHTAIAALPQCHWSDGSKIDLTAIGKRCREIGAALCIDSTQSVGAITMDVEAIQPDFMVASAYKWLLCPYTLAFLYAAPHRQEGEPLEQHRWNMAGVQAEATDVLYPTDFAEGAKRFDMGERNNFINIPMATAALEQIKVWTPEAIQTSLRHLTSLAADLAQERGWNVAPEQNRVGHFIGVRPKKNPPPDISEKLKTKGIHISLRASNSIRIAPYLFNDEADIHRTFSALDDVLD